MTRHNLATRLAALAVLALPLLAAACTSGGGGGGTLPTIPPESPTAAAVASAEPTHPGPTYPPGCPTSQPAPLAAGEKHAVTIETTKGNIELEVDGSLSPIATGNFVALAECGYYDGVVFHRLVPGFVIQGGDGQFGRSPDIDPDLMGTGGPPYTIKDEPVTDQVRARDRRDGPHRGARLRRLAVLHRPRRQRRRGAGQPGSTTTTRSSAR